MSVAVLFPFWHLMLVFAEHRSLGGSQRNTLDTHTMFWNNVAKQDHVSLWLENYSGYLCLRAVRRLHDDAGVWKWSLMCNILCVLWLEGSHVLGTWNLAGRPCLATDSLKQINEEHFKFIQLQWKIWKRKWNESGWNTAFKDSLYYSNNEILMDVKNLSFTKRLFLPLKENEVLVNNHIRISRNSDYISKLREIAGILGAQVAGWAVQKALTKTQWGSRLCVNTKTVLHCYGKTVGIKTDKINQLCTTSLMTAYRTWFSQTASEVPRFPLGLGGAVWPAVPLWQCSALWRQEADGNCWTELTYMYMSGSYPCWNWSIQIYVTKTSLWSVTGRKLGLSSSCNHFSIAWIKF